MPESKSLKRNTDNEVLPQGYSTESGDYEVVAVNEDGLQKVEINGSITSNATARINGVPASTTAYAIDSDEEININSIMFSVDPAELSFPKISLFLAFNTTLSVGSNVFAFSFEGKERTAPDRMRSEEDFLSTGLFETVEIGGKKAYRLINPLTVKGFRIGLRNASDEEIENAWMQVNYSEVK